MNRRSTSPGTAIPRAPGAEGRRIADSLVVVSCAYTSLEAGERLGLLDRERAFYARLWKNFGQVVFVSYGGMDDHRVASHLVPEMLGRVHCVCNDRGLEPGVFLASVPDMVARTVTGAHSALVLTEQHWGGDVAVTITHALRNAGVRTGLAARGGYHWSWTMAKEHGTDSAQFAQARFLEGELCRAADVVIATTQKILDDLALQHALSREALRLVPNFVLTDESSAPLSSRTPGLVLTAGRVAREKRIRLLIEAIASLPGPIRDSARLMVVGDGPEAAALRELAARLGVSAEFRSRIPHRELLALMRACRVYAQCSEYEGHPKTVLEAMACGSPVLVTDAPGLADRVHNGRTGVVARADAHAIADGLSRLLTSDADAAALGMAAAAEVRSSLGLDAVFPFYRQACEDAMHTAGAGRLGAPPMVRWDQPLLNLEAPEAAAAWSASIHTYAKRLDPAVRDQFAVELTSRLEGVPVAANDRA